MRFLIMHRLDEHAAEWNPEQEFIDKMGAFIENAIDTGVLITAEGVHPSAKGALVRKDRAGRITTTDGPFAEAKEVIGGFLMISAKDHSEAVEFARHYAGLFQDVAVEVRQVFEEEDLPE